MDFTLNNILQSLDGKTVHVREERESRNRKVSISVIGAYKHQPSGSGSPCEVGEYRTGSASFIFEDIKGVMFHSDDGQAPTIILKPEDG